MIEFKPWPKTPRFYRDITITEKIDGTNAGIQIIPIGEFEQIPVGVSALFHYHALTDSEYVIAAQSRKRLITPEQDNAGFARWVWANADTLVDDLGPGIHFGEWWGAGIQRKYDLNERYFSLFNTSKWDEHGFETPNLLVVPVLYHGPFSEVAIQQALADLRKYGSFATENRFDDPEGVVIYHSAANEVFKVLLENDDIPKTVMPRPAAVDELDAPEGAPTRSRAPARRLLSSLFGR